jgi:hypothetical protein
MSDEKGTTRDAGDVVKWYTRARKFPQLIGRTPDGTRIWGGPYTITQAVGAGAILFVGLNTMWLWASFGMIGNFVVLGLVTYGAVLLLGRIPVGSRNPFSVASGTLRAVSAPATGRLGGRPVRIRRPHQLKHTVVFAVSALPAPAPARVPAAEPAPEPVTSRRRKVTKTRAPHPTPTPPAAPPVRAPALTGVQALLAGQTRLTNHESHR